MEELEATSKSLAFLQLGKRQWSTLPVYVPHYGLTTSSSNRTVHSPSIWRSCTSSLGTAQSTNLRSHTRLPFLVRSRRTQQSLQDATFHKACSSSRLRTPVAKQKRGRSVPGPSSTHREKLTKAQVQLQRSQQPTSHSNDFQPSNKKGHWKKFWNEDISHSASRGWNSPVALRGMERSQSTALGHWHASL